MNLLAVLASDEFKRDANSVTSPAPPGRSRAGAIRCPSKIAS